eukprot:g4987.t1
MGTSRAVVFVSVSIFVGISTHLAYNIKRTMIDGVEPVQLKIDRGADSGASVSDCLIMSVNEDQWSLVREMEDVQRNVHVAFGVHPWHAHAAAEGWDARLRELLHLRPGACVGEIGLDKARCASTFSQQIDVFRTQLVIAAELRRPVSVHAVRCQGALVKILESLQRGLPPAVVFHSFGGSAESLKHLSRICSKAGCRAFFGFSASVNTRSEHATRRTIANCTAASPSAILVESDLPIDDEGRVASLRSIAETVSVHKDDSNNTHDILEENAAALLSFVTTTNNNNS